MDTRLQQNKLQQQNNLIVLEEIINNPQHAYLKRNANYYLPVTQSEVKSSIELQIRLILIKRVFGNLFLLWILRILFQ